LYDRIHRIFVLNYNGAKVAGWFGAVGFIITGELFIIGIVVSLLKYFINSGIDEG
jgi:hypothetical protein